MKKRILTLLLAVLMLLSAAPLPALADSVDNYEVIHSNFNSYAVENDPPYLENLRLKSHDYLIQAISTYHWNYGRGATPGQIWVERDDGVTYGPWQAVGRSSNGIANATWDVFPTGFVMEHDHYYCVMDSDEETWSWNDASDEIGFYELRGQIYTGQAPAPAQPSSSANTQTGTLTYRRIHITIDGREIIPTDVNGNSVEPFIYNSSTYLPLRAVAGALGLDVGWDDATSTVSLASGGTTTARYGAASGSSRALSGTLTFRNIKIVLDGQTVTPRDANGSVVEPFIYNDSTYLPVRALANALGLGVGWDNDTSTVILTNSGGGTGTSTGVTPLSTGNGVTSPATGKVSHKTITVDFGNGNSGGTVAVVEDDADLPESAASKGYTLAIAEERSSPVTISLDVPAPDSADMSYSIMAGVPFTDGDGNEGVYWYPLDTTYANGKATATLDTLDSQAVLDAIDFDGGISSGLSLLNRSVNTALGEALRGVSQPFTAVKIVTGKEYRLSSLMGHYELHVEWKLTDKGGGYLREDDVKRIAADLEDIYVYYTGLGYEFRRDFPIHVYGFIPGAISSWLGMTGGYNYLTKNLSLVMDSINNGDIMYRGAILTGGYRRDSNLTDSEKALYGTMAHEVFHAVQRGYVTKPASSNWFDEAAGCYYEMKFRADKNQPGLNDNAYIENSALTLGQYKGMVYDGSVSGISDGYARMPFIEYCMSQKSDFLKNLYLDGGHATQSQLRAQILKFTEVSSMAELARGYYRALVAIGSLTASDCEPWEIYEGIITYTADKKTPWNSVSTKASISGTQDVTLRAIAPYGAGFATLELKQLPANASAFDVTLPSGVSAVMMVIGGKSYSNVDCYYSTGTTISNIPVTAGRNYLLMVVNETDSSNSCTVKVTMKDEKDKYDYSKWIAEYSVSGIVEGQTRTTHITVNSDDATGKMTVIIASEGKHVILDYDSAAQTARGSGSIEHRGYTCDYYVSFSGEGEGRRITLTETRHYPADDGNGTINKTITWSGGFFYDV